MYAIRNEKLNGIEIKGEYTAKDERQLRANAFYYSKRKGHWYKTYDPDSWKWAVKTFGEEKPLTLGEAAPIEMPKFEQVEMDLKPKAKKSTKKAEAKAEESKPVEQTTVTHEAKTPDDLQAWKEAVMKSVEAVLDEAIQKVIA